MTRAALGFTFIMVSVVFAGCLSSDDGDDLIDGTADEVAEIPVWILDSTREALDETAFGAEVPTFNLVVASERISGEPTIAVTRTGAVFFPAIDFDFDVAGQTSLPRTVYVRSLDGGLTWEDKSPEMAGIETHPTSFDPYIYADPTTGRLFALDMGPHVACNKVSYSDDDGETWITRDGACVPGANDHPTIFAGPAVPWTNTVLYPNQLYLCTNQVTDSLCYQSPDGGLTWIFTEPAYLGYDVGQAGAIPEDPENGAFRGLCGGLHGHGHASFVDGTIYLGRDWCGEVQVAVSHDGGLTFDQIVISDAPEHDPADHDVSIATDSEGNAYAFWVGNGGRAVWFSRSMDQGMTWDTPINVTAPGVTAAKLPSMVAGAEGRLAFLYIGTEQPLGWNVARRVDCDREAEDPPCERMHPDAINNTTWNAYVGMSINAHEDDPIFALTTANHPDDPMKRGLCQGRCFGDQGGMYDFLDIDIDPMTGQLYIALVDVCSGDCDGPGKGKDTVHEKSVGVVAHQVNGMFLLDEPVPART